MLRIKRDNQLAAAETVRLHKRLGEAGITAQFFKGAPLAQLAYRSLEIKHSKDIDILVLPSDARATVSLLEQDGYRMLLPVLRMRDRHWPRLLYSAREVAMVRSGPTLQVEPHWRLVTNPRALSELDAASAPHLVDLPGYGMVPTLNRGDTFAYLCIHGLEHGWFRLK